MCTAGRYDPGRVRWQINDLERRSGGAFPATSMATDNATRTLP
jgi:hypothetical protein